MSILWSLIALLSAEEVELKVWHAYRDSERIAFEQLLQKFDAENPEIKINTLAVAYDSYATKLEAAIPRGNGPDLFVYAHEKVGSWSQAGLIAPIDTSTLDLSDLHPITLGALNFEENLYGLPLAFKCLALYQNTKLLKTTPKNTDELLALQKQFADTDIIPLAYQATEAYFHAPWMHGFGGGFFNDQGTAIIDSVENIDSLQFLIELDKQKLIPKEPTSSLVTQLFNQNQAALVINGPWFLSSINDKIEYEIHPLPIVSKTGKPAAPFLTVEGALISAHSSYPSQAIKLAQFLTTTEAALLRAKKGRQTVATLSAYDDPLVQNDKILAAFRKQLDSSVPTPNIPEMSASWEPLARAVRRVNRGSLTPKMALQQAHSEFKIFTKPPPKPANYIPYLILAIIGTLGAVGYLIRNIWNQRKDIKKFTFAYMYVAPAAIAMTALTAIPFIVGACVSLFAHHNGQFTFVGIANFLDIILARDWPITSPLSFYFTLVVTVVWTLSNVVLHVGIGIGLALLLREPWLKLNGVYRALLILPWAIPNYITALIWKGMFHQQFGAVNGILESLGFPAVSWFGQFSTAFTANLLTNTWLGFPFMMVVTLGALQSIPRDLEQAASVDGANGWQRFRHITLPLLKPVLMPAIVLGSVWTFNMFNIIYLVSAGEPDSSTDILISDAYRWAFTRGHRYGYASAYAVLIFFILLGYAKLGNKIAGRKTL
jgi:arabinogalactan oligomer / maltooligosaccharide transport system permease protein